MAGTVTLQGMSASEPAGQRTLGPLTIQGTIVIGETVAIPFVQGDNTVTVPTGAVGVVIIPPSTGAAALTYRTSQQAIAGAQALPISSSSPSVHTFSATVPASITVYASGPQTAPTSFWFW